MCPFGLRLCAQNLTGGNREWAQLWALVISQNKVAALLSGTFALSLQFFNTNSQCDILRKKSIFDFSGFSPPQKGDYTHGYPIGHRGIPIGTPWGPVMYQWTPLGSHEINLPTSIIIQCEKNTEILGFLVVSYSCLRFLFYNGIQNRFISVRNRRCWIEENARTETRFAVNEYSLGLSLRRRSGGTTNDRYNLIQCLSNTPWSTKIRIN